VVLSPTMVPFSGWGPYQVGRVFLLYCLVKFCAHSLKLLIVELFGAGHCNKPCTSFWFSG
jgi:hypothetical protein